MDEAAISAAAAVVADADALLIATGAGMGVDSGMPDFRGKEGFWRAYPPFRDAGVSFYDMATPALFASDPRKAWGFYGHRLRLYRETIPHAGYELLRELGDAKRHGAFAVTSNVDGHHERSGTEPGRVCEVHGSLMHLQCTEPCCGDVWSAEGVDVEVDMATVTATGELPTCVHCGALARPAVLMFGDGGWCSRRTDQQQDRCSRWLREASAGNLVVVEIGAGEAVPTIRNLSERLARNASTTLVRINPRDTRAPGNSIVLQAGGLEATTALASAVESLR